MCFRCDTVHESSLYFLNICDAFYYWLQDTTIYFALPFVYISCSLFCSHYEYHMHPNIRRPPSQASVFRKSNNLLNFECTYKVTSRELGGKSIVWYCGKYCLKQNVFPLKYLTEKGLMYVCIYSHFTLPLLAESQVWKYRKISEWRIDNDGEDCYHSLIVGTVSVFAWRDWGKQWKSVIRLVGVLSENQAPECK